MRLRYETIDKLCRSNKKIDSKVPLDILYFNQQDKLEKFPKLLFIAKLSSSQFDYLP